MIRVLLADDHTVLRESLALFLRGSGDCMVVGEAADGITAIEQALALRPDVAVVDISMPRTERHRSRAPHQPPNCRARMRWC